MDLGKLSMTHEKNVVVLNWELAISHHHKKTYIPSSSSSSSDSCDEEQKVSEVSLHLPTLQ